MFFKPFAAAPVLTSIVGAAHAQLQVRDINGDGSIDAFQDVQQNISRLAGVNFAARSLIDCDIASRSSTNTHSV